MNWQDVVEFMICGASAIQLGTVNFINPSVSEEIIKGLNEYCAETNISNISDLIGSYSL